MAPRVGIKWQDVDPSGLKPEYQERWQTYFNDHQQNEADGKGLRDEIQTDWDKDNPGGVNGKRRSFKIANGTIQAGECALPQRASKRLKPVSPVRLAGDQASEPVVRMIFLSHSEPSNDDAGSFADALRKYLPKGSGEGIR